MRASIALLLLSSAAAGAEPWEVELAAGPGGVSLDGGFVRDPVLSLRVGRDLWGFFTPGLRVSGVLGPEGLDFVSGGSAQDPTGDRAWSVVAEARFHTPGRLQALVDLGAGFGQLVRAQGASDETFATVGSVGPAFHLGGGLRGFIVPNLALGAGVAAMVWTSTSRGAQTAKVIWGSLAVTFDL